MNNTLVKKLSLPLITFLIAWVGGLSTIYSDWTWYESLNKPFFNPPNYLFGIVWPILYVLMAVVSFLHAQNIFKLYLMQLGSLLNCLSWTHWVKDALCCDMMSFIFFKLTLALEHKQDEWIICPQHLSLLPEGVVPIGFWDVALQSQFWIDAVLRVLKCDFIS